MTGEHSRRAAVLGTGTMGPLIALAFAEVGFDVRLWGRSEEGIDRALATVAEGARFLERAELGGVAAEASARVQRASRPEDAAGADVVVEALREDLDVKRDVFARLDASCERSTLLTTTTSGLRVSDIAAGLPGRDRVVAMHFWNPPHLMPLVEICGGSDTSPETIARARELAVELGKLPVVLKHEVLGFLGTRMQQAVVREAVGLLEAGVASADDIDLAVRASFGIRFPAVGPLESADLTGLDVIEAIHRYLFPDLDRSTTPQRSLTERVAGGDLGVKSGRGFHDWQVRDPSRTIGRRDAELVRRLRQLRSDGVLGFSKPERWGRSSTPQAGPPRVATSE